MGTPQVPLGALLASSVATPISAIRSATARYCAPRGTGNNGSRGAWRPHLRCQEVGQGSPSDLGHRSCSGVRSPIGAEGAALAGTEGKTTEARCASF